MLQWKFNIPSHDIPGAVSARGSADTMSSNLRRAPQAEQVKRTVLDAIALHKSGRLPAAIEKYRYALGLDPAQFDALRLMGIALVDTGQAPQGL